MKAEMAGRRPLEPVQKLSDEPRKEYAAGIWLFSFEACIRVI